MSPEAQRIAIAGACGWQVNHGGKYCSILNSNIRTLAGLFDPLIDLNAMHEAEKALKDWQHDVYARWLMRAVTPYGTVYEVHNLTCANAAQRAEAFLRTINKWEDGA